MQANGVKTTYAYDGLRLDTLTHRKANDTLLQSFDYEYDDNTNITKRTENGVQASFAYDALNRINSGANGETYTLAFELI